VHVDRTGLRTGGEGRALWTATTPGATFLQIAERCDREPFDALIGPFGGIVISDRGTALSTATPPAPSVLSHIQRDFRRHADGLAEQKTFGERVLGLTRRVFAAWRAYQHEHPDRDRLKAGDRADPNRATRTPRTRMPKEPAHPLAPPVRQTTCSRSGPRGGRSSPSRASSRPTTPPSARSAHRSSTEKSRSVSAPKATTASASPNVPYRPPLPADCKVARCSPISANSSPPTPAVINSPGSPEAPGTERLHLCRVLLLCSEFLGHGSPRRGGNPSLGAANRPRWSRRAIAPRRIPAAIILLRG
jgi:hypothetical protein